MKKKFWIVAVSLLLVAALTWSAVAAAMPGDVDGDGQITAFDAQLVAEGKAGKRTLSTEQAERAGGFSVRDLINTVLGKENTYVAQVNNGGEITLVDSVEAMIAAVAADGNTKITLLRNVDSKTALVLPYSCTLDLNGYTITTEANGIELQATGSKNKVTTIKNGRLVSHMMGIKVLSGGIVVDNMQVRTETASAIALFDTTDYASSNRIFNSTLFSRDRGCISCNGEDGMDFSNTGITLEKSTLIANKDKVHALCRSGDVDSCNIVFGYGVNIYNLYPYLGAGGYTWTFDGDFELTKVTDASVVVDGVTYSGMAHWSTPAWEAELHALAVVTTGNETVYAESVEQMLAAVASNGNTTIELMKDITSDTAIVLPYSCAFDLNGHTITPQDNGIEILAAGSRNKTTTIANGRLESTKIGIKVDAGAIVVDNMQVRTQTASAVALFDTTDYKAINKISNSTLFSRDRGTLSCNGEDGADFSGTGITVENTTMVANKDKIHALVKSGSVTPCVVNFGYGVHIYNLYAFLGAGGYTWTFGGDFELTKVTDTSVVVDGVTYSGMAHWSTPEKTVAGNGELQAEVINGIQTTTVNTVSDLVAAVASTGNTKIKLLSDVTTKSAIILPYSCTLDLNGYTITNTGAGNGIQITNAGSSNKTTTIKNGKLIYNAIGIRVAAGAIVVDNMEIYSGEGVCVAIYDPDASYKSINKVVNSTLFSPYACISFNDKNVDFRNTGITVDNSTLIAHQLWSETNQKYTLGAVFTRNTYTGDNRIGNIHFGKNVHVYALSNTAARDSYAQYSGSIMSRVAKNTSITVNGQTYTGMNHWSSEQPIGGTKILAIGNSFCYRLVQELYGIAEADGQEIFMTDLYYAGCTVNQHWNWLQNKTPNYQYWITNSFGRWIQTDITTINAAIDYQDWDVITLQQSFKPRDCVTVESSLATVANADKIYNYLKSVHPDARYFWQQSWAYQIGYTNPNNKDDDPTNDLANADILTREDQKHFNDVIFEVSTTVANRNGVTMIPSGLAWEIARQDPNVVDPAHTDYCHDGFASGGQYLNACVWYETIFGRSCIGNTYNTSLYDTYELTEELKTLRQEAAHAAVAQIHGEDHAK